MDEDNFSNQPPKAKVNIKVIETQSMVSIFNERPPLLESPDRLMKVGSSDPSQLQILMNYETYEKIDRHCKSNLSNEVGGFLIGCPYQWEGTRYVEIIDALEAESTSSSAVHLSISSNAWSVAHAFLREKYEGKYIVGWYHTHPRMSLFLSSYDLTIHKGFFREPWHTALVLDPTREMASFFVWDKDHTHMDETTGYYLQKPAEGGLSSVWNLPSKRSYTDQYSEAYFDEFFEPDYWYSRWEDKDNFVVKIKRDDVEKIRRNTLSMDYLQMGLCYGVRSVNPYAYGPLQFIRVTNLKPIVNSINKPGEWDFQSVFSSLKKSLDAISNDRFVEGMYYFGPQPAIIKKAAWMLNLNIVLIGNLDKGLEYCAWKNTSGETISRPFVEMILLEELSGSKLEKLLDEVMSGRGISGQV